MDSQKLKSVALAFKEAYAFKGSTYGGYSVNDAQLFGDATLDFAFQNIQAEKPDIYVAIKESKLLFKVDVNFGSYSRRHMFSTVNGIAEFLMSF